MRSALLALAAMLLAPVAAAHAGPWVTEDPAADLGLFPTADEVQSAVSKAAEHPWARIVELTPSGEKRPLRVIEITDRESAVPMEARVVTFIMTQQHGNEPAGTGAAVEWITALVAGKVDAAPFANQVVLLLPMANPDGATDNTRENAQGVDINRDHVGLETPEARAVHEVLNLWDVHIAMDHHEYGGNGLGSPVPVRLYDYDLTTLFPNHGNVRAPTRAMSEELMYDAIWPAAEAQGFTANEYGEQTVAGVPVQQVAGGPDPGILRNNFGLNNVAGLLIETRVDPLETPFHDAARRIAIHRNVMDTTISYASENAERFIAAKRESEREAIEEPAKEYREDPTVAEMPRAFQLKSSLDALMALHGLPAGIAVEGGVAYDLRHERQGLLGAILHPSSTRAVAEATPLDALPEAEPIAAAGVPSAQVSFPLGAVAIAVFATALLVRRRS